MSHTNNKKHQRTWDAEMVEVEVPLQGGKRIDLNKWELKAWGSYWKFRRAILGIGWDCITPEPAQSQAIHTLTTATMLAEIGEDLGYLIDSAEGVSENIHELMEVILAKR